jgi:hypothetical protein
VNSYSRNRAKGLCRCGNVPEVGKKSCSECLQEMRHKYDTCKANGICTSCCKHPIVSEKAYCVGCLERQKKQRERLKAKKLCWSCRAPSAPGKTACQTCLDKKCRQAATRRAQGQCRCGQPARTNRAQCQRCVDNTPGDGHGLTRLEALALLEKQNHLCLICRKHLNSIGPGKDGGQVDHCHVTGRVRGVLCMVCNLTAGQVEKLLRTNTLFNFIDHVGENPP